LRVLASSFSSTMTVRGLLGFDGRNITSGTCAGAKRIDPPPCCVCAGL
jgi:hypothetical protein